VQPARSPVSATPKDFIVEELAQRAQRGKVPARTERVLWRHSTRVSTCRGKDVVSVRSGSDVPAQPPAPKPNAGQDSQPEMATPSGSVRAVTKSLTDLLVRGWLKVPGAMRDSAWRTGHSSVGA